MPTKIVLLGTGNPNPDPNRSGPSVAIVVDGKAYIIDAGAGIVRRASAGYQKGISALRSDKLDHLFITHLHSDHTLGIPDILFTPWVMERKEPLRIWGPPGIAKMVKDLTNSYSEDIMIREQGLEGANEIGWRSVVTEIDEGPIFHDERINVSAFRNHHGSWKHSFGFRIRTTEGTIIISGDCSPTSDLIENYAGADILIHEVYCKRDFDKRSDRWKRYHADSHTSSMELAEIAKKVRPKKLVLYHQLLWGSSETDLLEEIRSEYEGTVISGNDLDVIEL